MIVKRELVEGIPVLHVYREDMKKDAPITIFLHGFMSAKEHNLHYAYNLVEQGVRVLLPEAYLHGERDEQLSESKMSIMFWQIVMTSIQEVGLLKQWIDASNFTGKVAVCGTSMGAITTTGCLSTYKWIEAAGILMGAVSFPQLLKAQFEQMSKRGIELPLTSPQVEEVEALLKPYDGYANESLITKVPVYMWHGEKDTTVPASMTKPFVPFLQEQGIAHKIKYVTEKRAGHAVSRKGLLECTTFIAQHLA